MKQFLTGPLADHARNLMRRVGYGELQNREGQISYAKRYHNAPYPRFHAYVEDMQGGLQINLHLDQKQASYEGSSAHGGEYEGPLVEAEMKRISQLIRSFSVPQKPASPVQKSPTEKNGGWLSRLFG